MDRVQRGIAEALASRANTPEAGLAFAKAIMTTDTRHKQAIARVKIGGANVTVAGCCKGSGMIAPNMATMLGYLTTDAGLEPAVLQRVLRAAVEPTFNRITVDECESTSDTVAMLASGALANLASEAEIEKFAACVQEVCADLAYQIVKDGEGATRVLEVVVTSAKTPEDAHTAARAIAVSPLVKTAVHGGDPNWGRIVQALGATRVAYELMNVTVHLADMLLFAKGAPAPQLDTARLSEAMRQPHVTVRVDLGAGTAQDRVLTCDLSREYVAINADYST